MTPRKTHRTVTFDSLLGQLCGHCMNRDVAETVEALDGVRALVRALEVRCLTAERRVRELEGQLR